MAAANYPVTEHDRNCCENLDRDSGPVHILDSCHGIPAVWLDLTEKFAILKHGRGIDEPSYRVPMLLQLHPPSVSIPLNNEAQPFIIYSPLKSHYPSLLKAFYYLFQIGPRRRQNVVVQINFHSANVERYIITLIVSKKEKKGGKGLANSFTRR